MAGRSPTRAGERRLFYGWIVVAAAMAGTFATATTTTEALSVYMKPISDEFHWSRTVISGAIALGTLLCAPASLLIGPVIDRYGARVVAALAAVAVGLGFMGMSLANGPGTFYLAVAVSRSAGVGIMGLALTTTVANWFVRKRGRAIALEAMGGSLSTLLLPLLAQFIIQAYDWRVALRVVAVIVWAVSVVPLLLFLKRRPEDVGLQPDGFRTPEPSVANIGAPIKASSQQLASETTYPSWRLSEAIRTPTLWLLIAGVSLAIMVLAGVSLHQTAYLIEQGLDPVAAAVAISFLAIGTGVSRLAWGFLSEKVPVRFCMASAALLMAAGVAVLLKATSAPVAYLAVFLFGVGMSGSIALEPVIYANYFGRLHLGSIRGFSSFFRWTTTAAGPIVAGLGYDIFGGYIQVYLLFLGVLVVIAFLLLAATPPKRRSLKADSPPPS